MQVNLPKSRSPVETTAGNEFLVFPDIYIDGLLLKIPYWPRIGGKRKSRFWLDNVDGKDRLLNYEWEIDMIGWAIRA